MSRELQQPSSTGVQPMPDDVSGLLLAPQREETSIRGYQVSIPLYHWVRAIRASFGRNLDLASNDFLESDRVAWERLFVAIFGGLAMNPKGFKQEVRGYMEVNIGPPGTHDPRWDALIGKPPKGLYAMGMIRMVALHDAKRRARSMMRR